MKLETIQEGKKQFFIRDGERFGIVCVCISALGNYICADIYRRDPNRLTGLHTDWSNTFCLVDVRKAVERIRQQFPGKRGGLRSDGTCPVKWAQRFGWIS